MDLPVRLGVSLGLLHPGVWRDVAVAADELGFESVWLPEHLVLPLEMRGELVPGEPHPPIPPTTPVLDAPGYLCYLAGLTQRVRLGTFVYLLGIRHPFVGARAFATLDIVSGGRAEAGVGAGWLLTEWEAVGIDPRTRGGRLEEAITICRRLWTEPEVAFDGRYFRFPPVAFEPKPVQQSGPPILIGGESRRALQRAVRLGDGWIGMQHTPDSAARVVAELTGMLEAAGRSRQEFTISVAGPVRDREDLDRWAAAGVDRVIVAPWRHSSEAVAGLHRLADRLGLAATDPTPGPADRRPDPAPPT